MQQAFKQHICTCKQHIWTCKQSYLSMKTSIPEHVNEYQGEHGCEQERPNVPGYTTYHVQQRFFVVNNIEKLQTS